MPTPDPAAPIPPDSPDELLERARNAYHAEYHRLWRDGGDAHDHDEAHVAGLEAVLELAGQRVPSLDERRIAAGGRCLDALGARWRGDWSDFDGRTLRSQLEQVASIMRSDAPEPLADHFVAEQEDVG